MTVQPVGNDMASEFQSEGWQLVHENERLRDEIALLRGDLEVLRLQRDAARLATLADEEREAISVAISSFEGVASEHGCKFHGEWAATLRGLLERQGGER